MGGFFVIGLIYWFVGTFSKYILIYKSIKELIKINLKTIFKNPLTSDSSIEKSSRDST